MSTTIDVYPTTDILPLVVETASRAEAMFNKLLSRHGVTPDLRIEPFYYPSSQAEATRYVEAGVCWSPGLHLGFHYQLHGEGRGNSFPCCVAFEEADRVHEDDLIGTGSFPRSGYDRRFLGQWSLVADLAAEVVDPELLASAARIRHYWYEYRSAGSDAVASTGYGFVAAALAEQTEGLIASWDCAFDKSNGQTAEQFLQWWGDSNIARCGLDAFLTSHASE